MSEVSWDPLAEVRCEHVEQCGACPLMSRRYDEQRAAKQQRLDRAFAQYGIELPGGDAEGGVVAAEPLTGYRRRAKLVVARREQEVAIGLYQRHDNQKVVDIPNCQVMSPVLLELVATLRQLASAPPDGLACLLSPADEEGGVLTGIDARELEPPTDSDNQSSSVLLTLILAAERAEPVEALRAAAPELMERLPQVAGLAASLRHSTRGQSSLEFVSLGGRMDAKDALRDGYQLVSHTSFLHVHHGQAERLYELLAALVGKAIGPEPGRVLDLYGGTGAIALSLAQVGHTLTLVESYPPAAALASRAALAQRMPVEVVTGDVASVGKVLAASASKFDVVVANPPRRGLSPVARESVVAIGPQCVVYVACDLDNLSRDLEHFSRLGYALTDLRLLDMLPLTEEIEVVAVLERSEVPAPIVLYEDADIIALNKPPHEPVLQQPEYPTSLVESARRHMPDCPWLPVLEVEAGISGVCIFARSEDALERYNSAFGASGRLVYLAAARGVTPAKGAITRELRGAEGSRPARTRYRRLAIGGGHSVLRVVPERLYAHQIRRHLAAIGHPVLGDARYGHAPTNRYFEEKHGLDRSFLHLVRVELDHPRTGERLLIESPLPPDLRAALARASDDSVIRFLENKRALGGARGRPAGVPLSERSPLSTIEEMVPESVPSVRQPDGGRVSVPELDEAPRTVRGELLTPGDDDD